jgi:putative flippase GtrA
MNRLKHILSRADITLERGVALFKFLLAGLPSFLLALPLNFVLVEWAHLNKGAAYATVITVQVSINFFMCRFFVFEKKESRSLLAEFGAFFTGIMLFRVGDWLVYVFLTSVLGFYYLAVQLVNVALFGALKFLFAEKILSHKPGARSTE